MTRTRFAPSPTGYLHIGGLRTALYAYAMAKKDGGQFLLRIEDTDKNRSKPEWVEPIFRLLKPFGLNWDEGPIVGGPHAPYVQSERVVSGIYKKAADKLINDGHAFYCFCKKEVHVKGEVKKTNRDVCRYLTKEEAEERINNGEVPAVRLRVPDNEIIEFNDPLTNKKIKWPSKDVADAMLLKSDGYPTYHLAVVVDDTDMQITHVFRGHDWEPSTPVHVLVYRYLGYDIIPIIHLTDILDPEGKGKLSKRKGNTSVGDFLARGYLPEALLNFIMLLGWAPKDNQEMFMLDEFVQAFSIEGLQKSNPMFNIKKLDWFNGVYVRKLSIDELASRAIEWMKTNTPDALVLKNALENQELFKKQLSLAQERMVTLAEVPASLEFFYNRMALPKLEEVKQLKEFDNKIANNAVIEMKKIYSDYSDDTNKWTHEKWEADVRALAEKFGVKAGSLFMLLRVMITYSPISLPLFESMVLLGKTETLERLNVQIK